MKVDGPKKEVYIGATLLEEVAKALLMLLVEFKEMFAWKPGDMSGIIK